MHDFLIHKVHYSKDKTLYLFKAEREILLNSISDLPEGIQNLIHQVKHPKRKAEIILKQWAILSLFPDDKVLKTTEGKPFLKSQQQYIGISHSGPYLAICVGSSPCSVDIEIPKEKILRLKEKFCNPSELSYCNTGLDYYQVWMAKECIFKLLGNASPQFYDYTLNFESNTPYILYDLQRFPVSFGNFDDLHYCLY